MGTWLWRRCLGNMLEAQGFTHIDTDAMDLLVCTCTEYVDTIATSANLLARIRGRATRMGDLRSIAQEVSADSNFLHGIPHRGGEMMIGMLPQGPSIPELPVPEWTCSTPEVLPTAPSQKPG